MILAYPVMNKRGRQRSRNGLGIFSKGKTEPTVLISKRVEMTSHDLKEEIEMKHITLTLALMAFVFLGVSCEKQTTRGYAPTQNTDEMFGED